MKTRTDILLNACTELALALAEATSNLQLSDNHKERFQLRKEITRLIQTYQLLLRTFENE